VCQCNVRNLVYSYSSDNTLHKFRWTVSWTINVLENNIYDL